ncbi:MULTISPECIES: AraC family transcriptional regulator [Brevibacterium]|uniref:AraC family transcriptional regulator n=3 Tax=Brevibacterium casei TaxID=33889 RepID=K9AFN7_9MICO|nr:AraC family transcriptional regulator [Brevibacterium casei]EKU46108.1 AraC family transcriptional regulator [Brevibacterium casei S18]NJE67047.1 AraC family transcriptional regulator [Brevibacterium sp. LS14]KZE24595.1 cupin [Brevibacterium casei]QPR38893.1 AraC family transcriptional regulator [Brevibacterium casei]QPR43059.1 AraC family transcriptional regulator [Brevibacterium casei]
MDTVPRSTGTVPTPGGADDRLARVLANLRMRSTFYCHAEFGDPWSLEMPAIPDSLSFHVLIAGTCWLRLPGAGSNGSTLVELAAGDLALVPHGAGHDLLSDPDSPRGPRVDLLPQDYLSESYSRLRYGGPGRTTTLICGVVAFDDPAARELMRALPPVLHVGGDSAAVASSVRETLRLIAAELAHPQPGAETVATRLADVLVVQAIRSWMNSDAEASAGWLRSLQDERIGRVIEAIHACPGHEWTLERLARVAGMSRSSLSARFAELVGEAPIAYLTRWRMSIAESRLRETDVTAARLAGELGYRSEAAFSRAFTRANGRTPGSVRRESAAHRRSAEQNARPR